MPFAMSAWVQARAAGAETAFLSLRGESACYRVYSTADDQPIALGAIEPKFWANFCRAVGKPQWIASQTNKAQQPALIEAVAALFKSRAAAQWADLLDTADCCFSRVIPPEELLDDAQVQSRSMAGLTADGLPWMRSPIRLSDDAVDLSPAPAHGEHSTQVLSEIGYRAEEIERLRRTGIIRQAP